MADQGREMTSVELKKKVSGQSLIFLLLSFRQARQADRFILMWQVKWLAS